MNNAFPEIPEDATIRYWCPTRYAGINDRGRANMASFPKEYQARDFAATTMSNGSGYIRKTTTFKTTFTEGDTTFQASYTIDEDLPPVTKFTREVEQLRERYLRQKTCKHPKTRTDMEGAGCQKEYYTTCLDCGKYV